MILAIGLYTGVLATALTDRTDRTPEAAAIDRVWEDASHGGVFSTARATGLEDVQPSSLPQGQNAYAEVTTVDDRGDRVVVAELHFDSSGAPASPQEGPPEAGSGIETSAAERTVPVETSAGDVRGGTLRVEVWST
ncbi:DUF7285 family protein [Natronolimnohabitans innermongolicus]|uniref:DUF7285 family protein n=1 Tax=Natronolimnohabitans innermongolicus TaxID=253107 RepID=UPI001F4CEAA2|nr:hypothetical protein [Natronolimnohabitans innermongolicus]